MYISLDFGFLFNIFLHSIHLFTSNPKTSTKNKTVRYCKTCGKELKSDQKSFCSKKCLREYSGNRPEYDELKSLLESGFNYCMIAEKYGVTEAAVRKWVKKYDIKR